MSALTATAIATATSRCTPRALALGASSRRAPGCCLCLSSLSSLSLSARLCASLDALLVSARLFVLVSLHVCLAPLLFVPLCPRLYRSPSLARRRCDQHGSAMNGRGGGGGEEERGVRARVPCAARPRGAAPRALVGDSPLPLPPPSLPPGRLSTIDHPHPLLFLSFFLSFLLPSQ